MKSTAFKRFLAAAILSLTFPFSSQADDRSYNTSGILDWYTVEERRPFFDGGNWSPFVGNGCPVVGEGASFDFYTGLGNDTYSPSSTFWHWSTWPLYGAPIATNAYLSISYLGTTTSGHAGNGGEGTSAGVDGLPAFGFTTNVWYRFAIRCWRPADGTPHLGYAGEWMREGVSGTWYHCATYQIPFAPDGITGSWGFMEGRSAGYMEIDFRNAFAHEYGQPATTIQRANMITIDRNIGGYNALIDNGTAVMSWANAGGTGSDPLGHYYTNNMSSTNNGTASLTMTNQPATPPFDPIIVSSSSATKSGTQLLVQWQLPATSSPQLGYRIEVFNGPVLGPPALTYFTFDPEARQKLLNIGGITIPSVRLTITDIFNNTNTPIVMTATTLALNPATNVAGVVPGLNYKYYTTNGTGMAFTNLPDFNSLTPALQGAAGYLDLSVRTNRSEYALNYTGFFQAPADGIYSFTLTSFDSSKLVIDGQTVVDNTGLHQPGSKAGAAGLRAGLHAVSVQYAFSDQRGFCTDWDGVWLACDGPGIINASPPPDATCIGLTVPENITGVPMPASAWFRQPGTNEPVITLTTPANGATICGSNVAVSVSIAANGATNIAKVQYYWAGTLVGETATAPYSLNLFLGAAPVNYLRARLWYDRRQSVDSALTSVVTVTNMNVAPWQFTSVGQPPIYPAGGKVAGPTVSLRGDAFNVMSRQISGDCTFIARLADITSSAPLSDGGNPDFNGMAGIILRSDLDPSADPLGGDPGAYFAVFGKVNGGIYYEDQTMVDGNGAPNETSGNLGGANKWLKLQKSGDICLTSVSPDGVNWTLAHSNSLSGFGPTIYAGLFVNTTWNALLPYIPYASFDSISLTGTLVGPPTASVSPVAATVYQGDNVILQAAVVGPPPFSYQWQRNGTNIPGAFQAALTLTNLQPGGNATYRVIVSSLNGSCVSESSTVTVLPTLLFTWDANTSLTGPQDGNGSWDSSAHWWNGAADVAWQDFSVAAFGVNTTTNCTVTLTNDVAPAQIIFNATAGTNTLAGSKTIWTTNTGLTLQADGNGVLSAPVSGTSSLIKTGSGTLTLNGDNPFLGITVVNAGTLILNTPNYNTYRGSGIYINNGSTFKVTQSGGATRYDFGDDTFIFDAHGGGTIDTSTGLNFVFVGSGNTFTTLGGAQDLIIGNSGFNLDFRTAYFNVARGTGSSDLKITAPLSNVGSLVKTGGGILELDGANSYNGATTISSGILRTSSTLGSGVVTVQAGGTLGRTGALGALALSSAPVLQGTVALRINRSATPNADNLSMSGLTLGYGDILVVNNTGGTLVANDTFTLFNASSYSGAFTNIILPPLNVGLAWDTSSLLVNGTIKVVAFTGSGAPASAPTALTLTPASSTELDAAWSAVSGATSYLVNRDGTGIATVTSTNYADTGLSPGAQYCYTVTAVNSGGSSAPSGNVCATLPMSGLTLTWDANPGTAGAQDGDGNWGSLPTWWNGTLDVAWQDFNVAAFGANTPTNCTVTLANDVAPAEIIFNPTSGGTYTLAGTNTIWTTNRALIIQADGNGIINAPLSGSAALVKTGSGTLTLNADNPFTGAAMVSGGTLIFNTPNFNTYQGSNILINNGATFKVTQTGGYNRYDFGDATFTFDANGGGTIDTSAGVNFVFQGNGDTFVTSGGAQNLIAGDSGLNINYSTAFFNLTRGTGSSDLKITAPLWNYGSVVTTGTGILELAGTNVYADTTTVAGGTLWVNGSISNGPVIVQAGGTLGGSGIVGGTVTVQSGGTLVPGTNGVGSLSTGTNNWNSGGQYVCEIKGTNAATDSDKLTITGLLNIQATSANPFVIKLVSLTPANTPGPIANFDKYTDYAWTNVVVTAGTAGLTTNAVKVDASAFNNDFGSGSFSMLIGSKSLVVRYSKSLPPPVWVSFGPKGGNSFPMTFSGVNGQSYRVLSSTNLSLPRTNWTQLINGTFGAVPISYTDTTATNGCQFYQITSP